MRHRYSTGQMVELASASPLHRPPPGPCRIVSCLPHDRGPLQYRVQWEGEAVQRVVSEPDLRPSAANAGDASEAEAVFGTVRISRR